MDHQEKNLLLEFSIFPLGKEESVSQYVARAVSIVDKSNIPYQLNPMGTVLEGSWEQVFEVVKNCFEELKKDCPRLYLNMKLDYRKGPSKRIKSKVESLKKVLKNKEQ